MIFHISRSKPRLGRERPEPPQNKPANSSTDKHLADPVYLATAPAGPWERRAAFIIVALSLTTLLVAIPHAGTPWITIPMFVPVYNTALTVIDAITALLLFGQFRDLQKRSLLVLACGYLFTSIVIGAHAISFPGVMGSSGLIGGSQSTAWLWTSWHGLFPCFVAAYAILARREHEHPGPEECLSPDVVRRMAIIGVLCTAALAAICILLVTRGHYLLPVIMNGNDYIAGITRPIIFVSWFLTLTALVLVLWCTRARRILDLWLAVVLCIWLIDILLSALLITGRFQIGFYVGRIYSLIATSLLLGVLLRQTLNLHRELVRALRTEQEQAHAVRRSEERLRRAAEIDTVGIIFFHTDGGISDANDAFLRMSGYDRQDLLEGKIRLDTMTPPEFMSASHEALEQLKTTGRTVPYEKQYIRKDGSRWWGLFAASLLPDGERVKFIIDITERRQAEEALKEAHRRKDEFLATLSHELRNPLAPIMNSLDLLQLIEGANAKTSRPLEIMRRQVKNLVRLVDDLLETSRLSSGKITLQTEPVDVTIVARNAIELSRSLIEAGEHELTVSLPDKPIILQADPVRLSQVIANLLNNAAKYTPPGGKIYLDVRQEPEELVISVRDNGLGIRPEMLPRIFQMFVQIDRDHKNAQGGLGIGLTLVRSLVEMHGGTVEAHSDGPGTGSEFVIHLPHACPALPAVKKPDDATATATTPNARRILVVDDNADAATTLGNLLEAMGNQVSIALDGASALKKLDTQRPHIAFVDLGMPGMSGYEIAERMSTNPAYRDITLVAVTGWGQHDDRRRTQAAGFHHHIVKPVDIAVLEKLLWQSTTRTAESRAGDQWMRA